MTYVCKRTWQKQNTSVCDWTWREQTSSDLCLWTSLAGTEYLCLRLVLARTELTCLMSANGLGRIPLLTNSCISTTYRIRLCVGGRPRFIFKRSFNREKVPNSHCIIIRTCFEMVCENNYSLLFSGFFVGLKEFHCDWKATENARKRSIRIEIKHLISW